MIVLALNFPLQAVRRVPNRTRELLDLTLITINTSVKYKDKEVAFFNITPMCFPTAKHPHKSNISGECCDRGTRSESVAIPVSYTGTRRRTASHQRVRVKCLGNHRTAPRTRNTNTDGTPASVLKKRRLYGQLFRKSAVFKNLTLHNASGAVGQSNAPLKTKQNQTTTINVFKPILSLISFIDTKDTVIVVQLH
ncbi:hypothetical protein EVAR_64435_1 [Eumeta japonica]|uniref:Uncharacterized protein n=1 Tax=Eumeta variegata TaxID=151549 RepID=A0A4C1YS88_EUMVA|nr:hypothetical protein EVAR_64435_1 [Eumeta japonica]